MASSALRRGPLRSGWCHKGGRPLFKRTLGAVPATAARMREVWGGCQDLWKGNACVSLRASATRPIGAAKGKHLDTKALCQSPPAPSDLPSKLLTATACPVARHGRASMEVSTPSTTQKLWPWRGLNVWQGTIFSPPIPYGGPSAGTPFSRPLQAFLYNMVIPLRHTHTKRMRCPPPGAARHGRAGTEVT